MVAGGRVPARPVRGGAVKRRDARQKLLEAGWQQALQTLPDAVRAQGPARIIGAFDNKVEQRLIFEGMLHRYAEQGGPEIDTGNPAQFINTDRRLGDTGADETPRVPELLAPDVKSFHVVPTRLLDPKRGATRGFESVSVKEKSTSEVIMPKVKKRLADGTDGPFFLYMHWMDAHSPYDLAGTEGTPKEAYLREVAVLDQRERAAWRRVDVVAAAGEEHGLRAGVSLIDLARGHARVVAVELGHPGLQRRVVAGQAKDDRLRPAVGGDDTEHRHRRSTGPSGWNCTRRFAPKVAVVSPACSVAGASVFNAAPTTPTMSSSSCAV